MTDVDHILDRVRARVFSKYRTHRDVEDLMQEASVKSWKLYQEHPDWDEARIVYFGVMKAQSLVSGQSGEAPTGKPVNRVQHKQHASGEASREKIRQYLNEYIRIHGKQPTKSQVADDLGMSRRNVRYHMDRLYLFEAGVPKGTKEFSLDAGLDAEEPPSWVRDIPVVHVDYDAAATAYEVRRAVGTLKDKDREFIYLEYYKDMRPVDVARALGTRDNYLPKMRKRILAQLREELET